MGFSLKRSGLSDYTSHKIKYFLMVPKSPVKFLTDRESSRKHDAFYYIGISFFSFFFPNNARKSIQIFDNFTKNKLFFFLLLIRSFLIKPQTGLFSARIILNALEQKNGNFRFFSPLSLNFHHHMCSRNISLHFNNFQTP